LDISKSNQPSWFVRGGAEPVSRARTAAVTHAGRDRRLILAKAGRLAAFGRQLTLLPSPVPADAKGCSARWRKHRVVSSFAPAPRGRIRAQLDKRICHCGDERCHGVRLAAPTYRYIGPGSLVRVAIIVGSRKMQRMLNRWNRSRAIVATFASQTNIYLDQPGMFFDSQDQAPHPLLRLMRQPARSRPAALPGFARRSENRLQR